MVEQERARILVVDDETEIRSSLDALLRRQGYEVATAANGEEALGWLMLHPFDLLLINPTLPGLSGLELAQCVRHCQPVAKVLFLSGQGEERVVQIDYLRTIAGCEYVLDRVARTLLGSIDLQLAA